MKGTRYPEERGDTLKGKNVREGLLKQGTMKLIAEVKSTMIGRLKSSVEKLLVGRGPKSPPWPKASSSLQ